MSRSPSQTARRKAKEAQLLLFPHGNSPLILPPKPIYQDKTTTLYQGNTLNILPLLPRGAFHFVITSPPYFQLVDYDHPEQIGLEMSIMAYLNAMLQVFDEIWRILPEGGVAWIVIQDTMTNYSPVRKLGQRMQKAAWTHRRPPQEGYFEKEPMDIPWLLRRALRRRGWRHRDNLIWDKGTSGAVVHNSDRAPTTHEYILQMVKWSYPDRFYGNCTGLKGSVLRHAPASDPYHVCPFPKSLVRQLMSVCPKTVELDNGESVPAVVCDPFGGTGTVASVAAEVCDLATGATRKSLLIDLDCTRAVQLLTPTHDQIDIWSALS